MWIGKGVHRLTESLLQDVFALPDLLRSSMTWQAVELRMAHAVSADLTTLGREIEKLATIEHRELVCVQWSQPTRSTADNSCRHIQRGSHAALLKLWPGVGFEVSKAVVHGDHRSPLRQRQLSPNTLPQLSNGQRVELQGKQPVQVRRKLLDRDTVNGPKSPVGMSLTEWYSKIGIAGFMLSSDASDDCPGGYAETALAPTPALLPAGG